MVASGSGERGSSQTNDWHLNISVSLCTHVQFDHVTLTRADTGQRGRRLPAHPQANHTATSILLSPAKARLLIFLPQPPRFRLNKDHAECSAMFTDVWWLLAHYICSLNYSEMRAAVYERVLHLSSTPGAQCCWSEEDIRHVSLVLCQPLWLLFARRGV